MRARVTVYPRAEILDPQGKAIRDVLRRVGFAEVSEVRAGKSFEVELAVEDVAEAERRLDRMCRKILANTVVEDYEIELAPDEDPGGGEDAS